MERFLGYRFMCPDCSEDHETLVGSIDSNQKPNFYKAKCRDCGTVFTTDVFIKQISNGLYGVTVLFDDYDKVREFANDLQQNGKATIIPKSERIPQ